MITALLSNKLYTEEKKGTVSKPLMENSMTQLRSVTRHMGSHKCYLLPDISERTPPSSQPDRLVLDLPTI